MTLDDVKQKRIAKQAKSQAEGGFVVCKLKDGGYAFASAGAAFSGRSAALTWLRKRTAGEIADFDKSNVALGSFEKRDGRMFFELDAEQAVGPWNKSLLKDAVKAAFKCADVRPPKMKVIATGSDDEDDDEDGDNDDGDETQEDGIDAYLDGLDDLPAPPPRPQDAKPPKSKPAPPKARPPPPAVVAKPKAPPPSEEETVTEVSVKVSLGNISAELAELILRGAPKGSWLVRFDEKVRVYVIASKYGARVVHRPTATGRGSKTIPITRKRAGLIMPGRSPLPLHKGLKRADSLDLVKERGAWLVRQGEEGGKRIITINAGGSIRHSPIGNLGAVKLVRTLKLELNKVVLP